MLEKEIIINNNKIKYIEKQGAGDAVFVFLHGWGSGYELFSLIYKELDSYIAFDFPGFGKSSKLKNIWTLLDYAKLTKNFIDKKANGKKLIFVAHSFGGRVLLKLLNRRKIENLKQIILIGVPFVREYGAKKKAIYLLTKIVKIILSILPKSITQKIRKIWYKIIKASDYIELEDEVIKKTFQNIINEDISEFISVLKNYKTDFIWGGNDSEAPLSDAVIVSKKINAKL
ncbi:MAG: alpha/beta hydrolase, partial [Patescibacteria group bacterium]|nr:alpha/beta hydrolase [Patescibacteria group bacterium]